MNIVIIVLDSFRQDHVGFYNAGKGPFPGIGACKTPNIDAFAEEAVVFDNAYPEALPTIPIRCQLMTGQRPSPPEAGSPSPPKTSPSPRSSPRRATSAASSRIPITTAPPA